MTKSKGVRTPAEILKNLQLSGEEDLDEQITNWIMWDKNAATLNQVITGINEEDWVALRERLCHRITFGPGGIRAVMRAGFDSMNDLTVIQTAQGLSGYLLQLYPSLAKRESQGIVIGYDGRHNSKRFAQLIAVIFLNNNFRVYLFQRTVCTSLVAFAVLELKCLAGIMVTASQYPKEDNGYSVIWQNGAIVLPQFEGPITNMINENLDPRASSWNLSVLDEHPQLIDPYKLIFSSYYMALKTYIPSICIETNECSQLRFIYTGLHGVAFPFVREAFYQARLKPVIAVQQQRDPDPEFPTISRPSLDCTDVMKMAVKKAEEEHCTVVLANDPDGSGIGFAELDLRGRWKIFNGNELGALLGWWALESYKLRTPKPNVGNCVMIGTITASNILASMARVEGFVFVETLMNWSWIGSKTTELMALGKTVLFAFDEGNDIMFSSNVVTRDGVSAACHLATMACYLRTSFNMTLIEKLREIYETYGYHATCVSYYICPDDTANAIFQHLRSFRDELFGTYPKCIMDGALDVLYVRDLTAGIDTQYPDRKVRLPQILDHELIKFSFTNGFVLTLLLRYASEHLKYYAEFIGLPEEKEWENINDKLSIMLSAALDEFLQPVSNNLQPPYE